MYHLVQAHSSYHLQYDGSNTIPTALYILVRIPRNSRAVHCSLRIRLSDGACVCFINSASPHSLETLMDRAVRQMELLQTCPLHILTFIIEERVPEYQIWHRSLWNSVSKLEAKTGMTPWAAIPTSTSTGHVDPDYKDFTNLLQEMHAANVELNLEETVLRFAEDLLLFCKKLIDVLEKSKLLAGVQDPLKPGHRASLEGQLEYNETILRFMRDKSRELLNRVNAQINVLRGIVSRTFELLD
ncbi:hypothetical protein BCR34DRAFT_114853 [Clohesyomyces aquaticus]|uniref:Uncharacterized protein n=1 Tax=Clohesyomyces aquaticus TaxID=1231657 RepID=A0A1Y1YRX5_9PLEO|nr:hypothetical protein BCR34DRAFT_114853 [Clohesyomyces aquaticus]